MSDDTPRPVATDDDKHTLTIEQVADRYASAGHARTVRTLQRYCKSGHLDCFKVPTLLGDKYRVTPESVERHLEQIREISATTAVATDRDEPRPVATEDAAPTMQIEEPTTTATSNDEPRPVATDDNSSRYVAHLENENEFLRGQISVKDIQIETSNKQIHTANTASTKAAALFATLPEAELEPPSRRLYVAGAPKPTPGQGRVRSPSRSSRSRRRASTAERHSDRLPTFAEWKALPDDASAM